MTGGASMRTLYLRPELLRKRRCTVLHISPLLRELIIEAVRLGALKRRNKVHHALCTLLVAEITKASPMPMMLAMPKDDRARRLSALVLSDPRLPLAVLCRKIGVSTRTMQRVFRRDVGIDFETWRRQLRLMKAIELLTAGKTIKAVTHAVGYKQASTFVAMFRNHLGITPRAFVASLADRKPLPKV
jgi:transcriptional regulator GlxA family with amidase domain